MAEKLTLTTPARYQPTPTLGDDVPELLPFRLVLEHAFAIDPVTGAPSYCLSMADLDAKIDSRISVTLVGKHGLNVHIDGLEEGAQAGNSINALNKANLSTKSLMKHVMERVAAWLDEQDQTPYAGTISGTPE